MRMPRDAARGCTVVSGAVAKVVALVLVTSLLQAGQGGAFGIPKFVQLGVCPPIKPQPNLNFEMYSGIWFPVEMVPNEYVDITYCAMTNYTWEDNLMLVEDRGLSEDGVKMRQRSRMFPEEDEPGMLIVDAEGVPSAPYVVVDTDYKQYSCVHSCLSMMGFRVVFSWVMSRRPTLEPLFIQRCHARLREWNLDTSTMQPVVQGKECPYMDKLDAVLEYSARLQVKAKAREVTRHEETMSTKAGKKKTVTSHGPEEKQEVMKEEIPQQDEAHQDLQDHQDQGADTQHTAAAGEALSRSEAVQQGTHLLLPLLLATLPVLATSPSILNW